MRPPKLSMAKVDRLKQLDDSFLRCDGSRSRYYPVSGKRACSRSSNGEVSPTLPGKAERKPVAYGIGTGKKPMRAQLDFLLQRFVDCHAQSCLNDRIMDKFARMHIAR